MCGRLRHGGGLRLRDHEVGGNFHITVLLYPLRVLCRAHQMLTILDAILPLYLRQLVSDKTADVKELREKIQGLSHALKTVIHNADKLTQ